MFPLVVNRRQLVRGGGSNHNRLPGLYLGLGVKSVKNRGTNENGKEESDYIHADTEKEGLQAADCVKGSSIHWILD